MAGGLTISTLNDSSGVLATQNGMTGIAKAWLCYNASTQTIRASFNISSVTYNSGGNYTINFTTAMSDTNYVVTGTGREVSGATSGTFGMLSGGSKTTSAVNVIIYNSPSFVISSNPTEVNAVIFR